MRAHIGGMTRTSYTTVPQPDGSFKVEVAEAEHTFMPDQIFADEAAAEAWIAEQLAESDESDGSETARDKNPTSQNSARRDERSS